MQQITSQQAGRRPRNPRGQGERLREEILDAADALLAESGDARTLSLRGVAKRVGIAATSVYLHFPDVEQLKLAVAARGFAEFAAARDVASHGISDPCEALLARGRSYAHYALQHPGRYRLMFGPGMPPALTYDAEGSPSRQALQELARGIARCRAALGSHDDEDPLRAATMLWAALHGNVILRIDRPHFPWPPLDETIAETVRRIVGIPADGGQRTR